MSNKSNEVFRFASFRGAEDNYAINIEIAPFPKSEFLNELRRNEDSSREDMITLIESKTLISFNALKVLSLHKLADRFFNALESGDVQLSQEVIKNFGIRNESYFQDLLTIQSNWILIRARIIFKLMEESQNAGLRNALERTIRFIACVDHVKKGRLSNEIEQLEFMLNSVVVTPGIIWSLNKTRNNLRSILDVNSRISEMVRNVNVQRQTELDFNIVSGLGEKLDAFYFETERELIESFIPSASDSLAPVVNFDSAFFDSFKKSLNSEESVLFEREIEPSMLSRTRDIVSALDVVGDKVNKIASRSNEQLVGLNRLGTLYSSGIFKEKKDFVLSPTITSLGMMDLFTVREELARYEAGEISHIENILEGEAKKSNYEKTTESEETRTSSISSETETEESNETTNSTSLSSSANSELKNEFGLKTGFKAKYGAADISVSTNTDFKRSKSESDSSSHTMAKDVTKRSSQKVKESFQSSITNRSLVRVFEQNSHDFVGIQESTSGVYKHVEKIQKVSLHHYGKRMAMEFMIPEPALYYLGREKSEEIQQIPPFDLSIESINRSNYMALANRYSVSDIPLPPEPKYLVGFSWNSEPNEEQDDYGQIVKSAKIQIPDGYHPTHFRANVEIAGGSCDIALGGMNVLRVSDSLIPEGGRASDRNGGLEPNQNLSNFFSELFSWKQIGSTTPYENGGIPITITVLDSWDNISTVNISIRCSVDDALMQEWRLAAYDKLKEGYERKMLDRQAREESHSGSSFSSARDRSRQRNKEIEKEEIKKFCIATMRERGFGDANEFDAISLIEGGNSDKEILGINFGEFEKQSPVIRFFEDAFEWDLMYSQLYPYFWGRKDGWDKKNSLAINDNQHLDFMRAGAAKVVVTLKPGYEDKVLHYLESEAENEHLRINGSNGHFDGNSSNYKLWSEILTSRREELIIGDTTLKVENGISNVQINGDNWKITNRDRTRNLYIEGEQYTIKAVSEANNQFTIDRPYRLESNDVASFVLDSVQVGAPWEERLPTNLVILSENENQLN
ncbi:MAG: hypothetical protein AB8B56_16990 [Crocinitomicaceae bacterium]